MDAIKEAFAKAKQDISDLRESIDSLRLEVEELKKQLSNSAQKQENDSFNQENPTVNQSSFHKPRLYPPISPNTENSIGNKGVPTDSQSVKQSVKQPSFESVLQSVDSLKDRVKSQFRNLTKQEMAVFSAIYLLEDRKTQVDYPSIASRLGLTESSIRDYVHKMIKKGIPIIKHLEKNKKVYLSIDENLKRVAPLSSLMLLREH